MIQSKHMHEWLRSAPFYQEAVHVHCYISMMSEVDTTALLREMVFEGKKVYCPAIAEKGNMTTHVFSSLDQCQPSKLGTLEPESSPVRREEFDLIIIPGLAFDRQGNRLGRGKGYYDRFLMKNNGLRLSFAFDFQIANHIPTGDHDQRLDVLITSGGILELSPCK